MSHLVRHRTPTGEVVTEEVADLETAVARVEVLRNEEGADDVRVWAEVPLRVETVVRVSVDTAPPPSTDRPAEPTAPAASEPAPPEAGPEPPAAPVDPPPGAMLAPVRVEAPSADAEDLVEASEGEGGRRGLFHRT